MTTNAMMMRAISEIVLATPNKTLHTEPVMGVVGNGFFPDFEIIKIKFLSVELVREKEGCDRWVYQHIDDGKHIATWDL